MENKPNMRLPESLFKRYKNEDIMEYSETLYTNEFAKNLTKQNLNILSKVEEEYFRKRMHEKLNLDGYFLSKN